MPQIIGGLCHYTDGSEKIEGTFFLLYPLCHKKEEQVYEKAFSFPNKFMLRAFRGSYFELLCDDNLSFWKYYIKKYMKFFSYNSKKSLLLEVKRRQVERIKKGIYGSVGRKYYSINEYAESIGRNFINKFVPSGRYICIYARDSGYYKNGIGRKLTEDRMIMHSFRNSDIDNFSLTCEYFVRNNIYSVRIGSHVESPWYMDGVIDYASKLHDPFLDIYLQAKCEFVIGDDSGALSFAALFSTPVVSINVPLVTVHEWDPVQPMYFDQDLMIMVKMWDMKRQRFLTLRDMIKYEIDSMQDETIHPNMGNIYLLYHKNEIKPIMNSPQEILDVAIEMHERIKGIRKYDAIDDELQKKYMKILEEANYYKRRFAFPARMGAKFLRENQWLLE